MKPLKIADISELLLTVGYDVLADYSYELMFVCNYSCTCFCDAFFQVALFLLLVNKGLATIYLGNVYIIVICSVHSRKGYF